MSNISEDSVKRANGRVNDKYRDNWDKIFGKTLEDINKLNDDLNKYANTRTNSR